MNITFTPPTKSYFPLLLKWLQTPHVKAWWNTDIQWTPALIHEKYATYVKGYKLENGSAKAIHAYIICVDNMPSRALAEKLNGKVGAQYLKKSESGNILDEIEYRFYKNL